MVKRGHLFVISGPSGAGKSTVIGSILEKRPQLRYSVSYTTRLPREKERHGVDYHFISEQAFRERVEVGEFAEWAEVHGHMYGTSATFIEETLARGGDILLDIDVQGAKQLLPKFPEAVSIFIVPPTARELEKRLVGRETDSPEVVARRLKNAEAEMAQADCYDHVVVNDDLARTISGIEAILEAVSSDG